MDTATIGIMAVVGANIIVTVFSAGRLYQKVGDLSNRISKLEKKMENTDSHLDKVVERLARLEGKLER